MMQITLDGYDVSLCILIIFWSCGIAVIGGFWTGVKWERKNWK